MVARIKINKAPGLADLLNGMQELREAVHHEQQKCLQHWQPYLRSSLFLPSATNLAAYIGLRRRDIRELQVQLARFGLSSLGRSEGHVLSTLDAVIQALRLTQGQAFDSVQAGSLARVMAREATLLRRHTNLLLGSPPPGRWTRIMVTLPSEAASRYTLVRELMRHGMNCARINCAHDDRSAWRRMVMKVRKAEQETGCSCKILVDLAGVKLRTGALAAAPPILCLKPKKDARGGLRQPAQVILDGSGRPGQPANYHGVPEPARLSVPLPWLRRLKPQDLIRFQDVRGKHRELVVHERRSAKAVLALCHETSYIEPGTPLTHAAKQKPHKRKLEQTLTGQFMPAPLEIVLYPGDLMLLTRQPEAGKPAEKDHAGKLIAPAQIACTPPEIIDQLKAGQRVWIDDGRIGAEIEAINDAGALLRVTIARQKGEKLKAEKGLNFPDCDLSLPALTEKDFADLDFVIAHADLVGYSFVQDSAGMEHLISALAERGGGRLGIVAKIETRQAVKNLPDIIVQGAGRHPFGVMIARGDLALEIGYQRLAEMQEEILWLCEAAHVPVVWATQVLEKLVKEGIPSRAEITDAAMSERAECVMLNKGPFILQAMDVLEDVITRMQAHQHKKTAQLRALHW